MENLLQQLSRPVVFLARKGALSALIALVLATYLSAVYRHEPVRDVGFLIRFLRTDTLNEALMRVVWFGLPFAGLLWIFTQTRGRVLNTPLLNGLACVFVTLCMLVTHPNLGLLILLVLALLWILSKLGGYETVFTLDGDAQPWDGRFASSDEIRAYGLKAEKGIILGIEQGGKRDPADFIRFTGEGNVICFAPAGKGKTSGPVIANAVTYEGSAIFNDPKAEITLRSLFARLNLLGQTIRIIDPFGECERQVDSKTRKINRLLRQYPNQLVNHSSLHSELQQALAFFTTVQPRVALDTGDLVGGINPMTLICRLFALGEFDKIYAEANVLADIMVVRTGAEKDPHWDEKAKMVIRNAILYVTFSEVYADEPKNLVTVRQFILRAFSSNEVLHAITDQCRSSLFSRYLEPIASEFIMIGQEERSGVLSNVLRHTELLDDPFVSRSIARDDCDLSNLKHHPTTIYLVLPLSKLAAYSRLPRLWVATLMQTLMADMEEPTERVLLMLDEAAQLGRLEPLEQGISYLRQYGVNMYLIFQDMSQLKSLYAAKAETIVANCRFKQYFGVSDQATADHVSKETGNRTLTTKGASYSEGSSKGGGVFSRNKTEGFSTTVQADPVIRPEQVRRSPFQYIIPDEGFPIQAQRFRYFEDDMLKQHMPYSLPKNFKDL